MSCREYDNLIGKSDAIVSSESMFNYLYLGDLMKMKGCMEILRKTKTPIWEILDEESNTLLHRAAFIDNYNLLAFLLENELETSDYQNIKKFVNIANKHGFQAIHYASYQGNIDMINILIKFGADFTCLSNNGLNVLHLAAQTDQLNTIVYLVEKHGMSITEKDKMGSAPLHWACYTGSESVVNFLLERYSEEIQVNDQDKEGLAPLHLAVISEKSNIVKKLLYRGADITLQDKKKRTAYALAVEKNKPLIAELLKRSSNCEFLMKKNARTGCNFHIPIFLFSHILACALAMLVMLPVINNNILTCGYLLTFFSLMLMYHLLIFSNPGVINQNSLHISFLELIEQKANIKDYCPVCAVKKEKLSKHCIICEKCVKRFDHHCYWVDNCIGNDNTRLFYSFLIFVLMNLLFNFLISLRCFLWTDNNSVPHELIFKIPLPASLAALYSNNHLIKKISSCVLAMLSLSLFIHVSYIMFINVRNIFRRSKQLNENYSHRGLSSDSSTANLAPITNLSGDSTDNSNDNIISDEEKPFNMP